MAITSVRLTTGSGREVSEAELREVQGAVGRIELRTDDDRIPLAQAVVDPSDLVQVRHFQRVCVRASPRAGQPAQLRVPVLEVTVGEVKVRLYLHPEMGPVLSTQDLYF